MEAPMIREPKAGRSLDFVNISRYLLLHRYLGVFDLIISKEESI